MDEEERREAAQANKGKIVKGSGTRGSSKRLAHMVSVRLEPGLVSELGAVAKQRGVTLSEVLRDGARLLLANSERATNPAPKWGDIVQRRTILPLGAVIREASLETEGEQC